MVFFESSLYMNAFTTQLPLSSVIVTLTTTPCIQWRETALVCAAKRGDLEMTEMLIHNGARVQHTAKVMHGEG